MPNVQFSAKSIREFREQVDAVLKDPDCKTLFMEFLNGCKKDQLAARVQRATDPPDLDLICELQELHKKFLKKHFPVK